MEQEYKLKIENNLKSPFCLNISNSKKSPVSFDNFICTVFTRPEIKRESTFSNIHALKNNLRTFIR